MLKPEYLDALPDSLVELYSQVEQDILADMAWRISQYNYWIPAVEHQRQKLREMGLSQKHIIRVLSQISGKSQGEIKRLMQQACDKALESDRDYYRQHGWDAPSAKSPEMKAILNAGLKSTKALFKNLTKTTASAGQTQFVNALDKAWLQINSGAFDYSTAIRNAIKDLARQGLHAVRYASGRADTLEVAVRRAIVTGVNQTAGQMQWQLADELGCDLVETTAHAGARPEHAVWQGKIYSRSGKSKKYPDFRSSTGYGTGAGLLGWNCRHNFNPYVEGSPRAYSDELLQEYNAKKYEYNGKKLTEYEASQMQRYHERQIRRWKRENVAMQAAGQDTTESAAKIRSWQERQKEFIRQTGLKRQSDREQIAKTIAGSGKSGIINTGSIAGALDPLSPRAEKHAIQYYESVRHMKTDAERIAKNTGWEKGKIAEIKNHVFIQEHDLLDGHRRFDPSFEMAQSWQRLIDGKDIRECDLVLLKHEYLELTLMKKGYSQNDAHIIASKKYDYASAVERE